jgi:MFS superfamily sulfate permease-like transporter
MPLFKTFREDLSASLVVFLVALPLCLGIALASGAPLMSGLIAGIVGGIVAGSLSGSPLGVSGPAAGLAVIVLSSIESLTFPGFLMAVVLAGVIQIALGLARAGTLGNFFPSPVIKGMLTGIGIIIILKQLPHAVGFDADFEGDETFAQTDGNNSISALLRMFGAMQPVAIFISLCALSLLVLWDKVLAPRAKLFRLFPGALAAVLFGVVTHLLVQAFAPGLTLSPAALVNVPVADNPAELFSILDSPNWAMVLNREVWFTAAVIAVVASLETLLSVEAIDKLDPYRRKTPANRELFAQGASNIASGLLGGLPVTQVIVRSSANVQSGAQGKLSAIAHGFLILILVLAIPALLNLIPLSVLASVLILTGYKLAKPAMFLDMYRRGSEQFVPFVATIAGVVLTDLLIGISIGMTIAILTLLYRNYRNSHRVHLEQEADSSVMRLSLCEEVSFLNKSAIVRALESIPDNAMVVLDASRCYVLDNDVAESLREFLNEAHHRSIDVQVLCSESPLVKPRLDTSRVYVVSSH